MGERMLAVRIDEEFYTRIKVFVAQKGMTMKDFVTNAVEHEMVRDSTGGSSLETFINDHGETKITLNDLVRYMKMDVERKHKEKEQDG